MVLRRTAILPLMHHFFLGDLNKGSIEFSQAVVVASCSRNTQEINRSVPCFLNTQETGSRAIANGAWNKMDDLVEEQMNKVRDSLFELLSLLQSN